MATIVKRQSSDGAITYQVKVRLSGYPAQSATFKRLTDAKRWNASVESAIREGRHFPRREFQRHSLGDAIDRYLMEVLPGKRLSTQGDQHTQLLWWRDRLGAYALSQVSPALIIEMRDALKREPDRHGRDRTGSTVNRYLAALSHLFTVAVKEWHWTDSNPLAKTSKLKEGKGRTRYLSDAEREALLSACKPHPTLFLSVILALSTGARKQEIMELTRAQVELARGLITLEVTKNGEARSIPLTGSVLDLMRQWGKVRRIDTDLVFPSRRNPHQPIDLRGPWVEALKRAGINDFRFHDLRHSCASYLAMSGATTAEIAGILGHKTLTMVKRYAHLNPSHLAGVAERMTSRFLDGRHES